MYKLSIINELTGRAYSSTWESLIEKNEYLDKCIGRQSWGKNERKVSEEDITEELRSRIVSTEVIPQIGIPQVFETLDPEGNVIIEFEPASLDYEPERTVHTVKADYVITEEDLSLDKAYCNKQKLEARKKEYRSIEEVLHVILDHGIESQEYADLQTERAEIKARHPKE